MDSSSSTPIPPNENNQEVQPGLVMPPDDLFEQPGLNPVNRVTQEERTLFELDHIEYPEEKDGGGVYVYLQGLKYPTKGFPTPMSVAANNVLKRVLISSVNVFAKHPILTGLALVLLPKRTKLRVLSDFINEQNRLAKTIMSGFFMKKRFYSLHAKAIWAFTDRFLRELGLNQSISSEDVEGRISGFSRLLATVLEYDSAYQYIMRDVLSETTAEKMKKNPRKEVMRLFEIFKTRSGRKYTTYKIGLAVTFASCLLFHPTIRRAFSRAIDSITFSHLQSDEADRYHTLRFSDYNFGGELAEPRLSRWVGMHDVMPAMFTVSSNQPATNG